MDDKNALAGSDTNQSTDSQPDPDSGTEPLTPAPEGQTSDIDASAAKTDSDATGDDGTKEAASTGEEGADKAPDKAKEAIDGTAKRKGTKASERISQLTAQKRTAEAQRDAANARAKRAEARLEQQKGEAKPKPSGFDTDDEYDAALTAWSVRQSSKSDRELDVTDARAEAKEAAEEAQRISQEAFAERADDFAETATDFYERVNDPSLPVSVEMQEQIYESDKGPQIAYWLSKNRGDASRIAKLKDPRAVSREIGRIEGRLTQPEPKRVTQAPDPVKSQAKGSGSQITFDPAKASGEEIEKRLRAKGVII